MKRTLTGAVVSAVLLLSGCASDPAPAPGSAEAGQAAAPSAAPTTAAPGPVAVDASTVVKKLKAADLGLTRVAVQDEDTDPNNLLGRPNGYETRASADLPGGDRSADRYGIDRGLVVESFFDAEAAQRRSDYIQGLQKESPILGTEWHYLTGDGLVLVRVSGNVKPSLAKKIEAALAP